MSCEESLLRILALDRAFRDCEFIHANLLPAGLMRAARRMSPARAFEELGRWRPEGLSDDYPDFRRTYWEDFIDCALAQAEVFAFGRRRPFVRTLTRLMATPPPPPFDLEAELERLSAELRRMGYSSLAEYNRKKRRVRLRSRREMVRLLEGIVRDVSDRLCADPGLAPLLKRSRVRIVTPRPGEPPCFYKYEGDYRGVVGIASRREFAEAYLRGFVYHELLPGHHLYYLLKQRQFETEGDPLVGLDTYYSPENPVNEGLAVCSDLLFGPLLDAPARLAVCVEKFLHRVFYNAWHSVNVRRRGVGKDVLALLRGEGGYGTGFIRSRLAYHTREARYYTPAYPIGVRLVEKTASGLEDPRLLFRQHSARTLKRMTRHAPARG